MAFRDFPEQQTGIQLLQRSLEHGRLAHAYLFSGNELGLLQDLAGTLARTLNCINPITRPGGAIDCCDQCLPCQKINHGNHADVHWVRPESKSRIVTVEQIRELIRQMQLKPNEAQYKVAVVVAADRLRVEAANAFLKTLEEPPPKSILILLSTEPQRLLDTILSRCLRLNFGSEGRRHLPPAQMEWLKSFSAMAAVEQKSLLGRYQLMDLLLGKLNASRAAIDEELTARSPLQQYQDAEKETLDQWEEELKAAVEAEYRRQRMELLAVLQWWLRDVWLLALGLEKNTANTASSATDATAAGSLLNFPQLQSTGDVARRISAHEALENLDVLEQLQRWLGTNVQEALALEVGLLKLKL